MAKKKKQSEESTSPTLTNDGHISGPGTWAVVLQDKKYYAIPSCEVNAEDERIETISTHDSYMESRRSIKQSPTNQNNGKAQKKKKVRTTQTEGS